jgi:hypothetical protein
LAGISARCQTAAWASRPRWLRGGGGGPHNVMTRRFEEAAHVNCLKTEPPRLPRPRHLSARVNQQPRNQKPLRTRTVYTPGPMALPR